MGKRSQRMREAAKIMDRLIREIAKEENLPERQISDVLQYTYGWVVTKMQEGEGKGVRIPYWGAFAVKPFQKKRLDEKNRTKNEGGHLQRNSKQEESCNSGQEADQKKCSN